MILLTLLISFILHFGLVAIDSRPIPLAYENRLSVPLTATAIGQMTRFPDVISFLFGESTKNPYIFGWSGDKLYFKNGWGQAYEWNGKHLQKVTIESPQFLRQEWSTEGCDVAHRPQYSPAFSSEEHQKYVWCQRFVQGDVSVELWPMEQKDLLSAQLKHVVIHSGDTTIKIDEPRVVTDVVISEDARFVALTVSAPQQGYGSFAATDIHVLELP